MRKFKLGEVRIVEGKHGSVFVTRDSILTGKPTTMCIGNTTVDEIAAWMFGRANGQQSRLVQVAFPHLRAEEREFLISGITDDEWHDKVAKPEIE